MNNPTIHFILTSILFFVTNAYGHTHITFNQTSINYGCDIYEETLQASCACDPNIYEPVCVLLPGGIVPSENTIEFPNICYAICEGFSETDIVPCSYETTPCGCDPNIYEPVCVLADGYNITYPNPCMAACDGYTQTPCDDQIYPGDVNCNGEVNNLDFLLLTTEYGKTGPARTVQNTSWDGWDYTSWNETFYEANMQYAIAPSNLDIAMADANGDGIIEEQDIDVIYSNSGNTRPNAIPFDYPEGIDGLDPKLDLTYNIINLGEHAEIELTISTEGYIQDLQGLIFSIEFDETSLLYDIISDITFDSFDGWVNNDGASIEFSKKNDAKKSLNFGIARLGNTGSTSGEGVLAKVNIIIIGDAIIMDNINEDIKIKNTYLLDWNKNNIPAVNGETRIQSETTASEESTSQPEPYEINLFPNPTYGLVMFDFINLSVYTTIVTDQYGNIIAILDGQVPEFYLWGHQPGYYHFTFHDFMGMELATRSILLQ